MVQKSIQRAFIFLYIFLLLPLFVEKMMISDFDYLSYYLNKKRCSANYAAPFLCSLKLLS